MSIRDIFEDEKYCFATTIGTTMCFKASRFGWYYETCPSGKSSNKSARKTFQCDCGVKDVEPVTKFKIKVEVEYGSHKGTFVFWDKDSLPYTKATDIELRQIMAQAGEDNPKIWPVHLDILLKRDMAFHIKYQSTYEQFSIVTILNGGNVYNRLKSYLTPHEIPLTGDQCLSAQPSSTVNQTGSPSASSSSTPPKRVVATTSVNDAFDDPYITPKQSTTKAKPGKKVKHLKKE
ncbi:hypothetical protein RYX36_003593 [Vicia faba]